MRLCFRKGDDSMSKKLPPAKDWRARSIDQWNTHTFFAYLQHAHREELKVDYFSAKGIKIDLSMIKRTFDEFGKEITKMFIDQCLKQYTSSSQYKVCTFWFMRTYMIAQVMPKAQEEYKRMQDVQVAAESNLDDLTF